MNFIPAFLALPKLAQATMLRNAPNLWKIAILGHPLTFGAFCGAFSVVSVEICAIWPTYYLTILYQKNGSHYYIFVVISTIFPPLILQKQAIPKEREIERRGVEIR